MQYDEDKFFHFTAVGVPSECVVGGTSVMEDDVLIQFTKPEMKELDLTGMPIRVEHIDMQNPLGKVVHHTLSDKGSLVVVCEVPPVPVEERQTPLGKRKSMIRFNCIEKILNGEFPDVSLQHENRFIMYEDDMDKIDVLKKPREISLTHKGGRPGSRIEETCWSDSSFYSKKDIHKNNTYEPKPIKSFIKYKTGERDNFPQYIKANLELLPKRNMQTPPATNNNNNAAPVNPPAAPTTTTSTTAPTATTTSAGLPNTETLQTIIKEYATLQEKYAEAEKKIQFHEQQALDAKFKAEEKKRTEILTDQTTMFDILAKMAESQKGISPDAEAIAKQMNVSKETQLKILNEILKPTKDDIVHMPRDQLLEFINNGHVAVASFNTLSTSLNASVESMKNSFTDNRNANLANKQQPQYTYPSSNTQSIGGSTLQPSKPVSLADFTSFKELLKAGKEQAERERLEQSDPAKKQKIAPY